MAQSNDSEFQCDPGQLTPAAFMKKASNEIKLNDFGDDSFLKGLEVLIWSVLNEANLAQKGLVIFQTQCVNRLKLRLLIQNEVKKFPEILEAPITEPLFITGLPRSGTTILHRLFSLDDNLRPLLCWEQLVPAPSVDPLTHKNDPRIAMVKKTLDWMEETQPDLARIHSTTATSPEECNGLFATSFTTRSEIVKYHVPSYIKWLSSCDMVPAYRYYKKQLQILSWKFPQKRWCLKAPAHRYFLNALLQVFPDARLIYTHRNPANVVPSTCSMTRAFRQAFSNHANEHQIGPYWLGELEAGCRKGTDVLEARKDIPLFHLAYKDIMARPFLSIKNACEQLALPLDSALETKINTYLEQHKKDQHGEHHYNYEEFGLTKEAVDARYEWYIDKYSEYL